MQRLLVHGGAAVLALAACLFSAGGLRAEEGGKHAVKVKVTRHEGDKEVEVKLDLSKDKDRAALLTMLEKDEVHHLVQEEERNLLALKTDLGIWTLVVFILLLLIVGKFAWKPMLEGLQKREQSIQAAFDEAAKARQETAALKATLTSEMAAANHKVRELMDEARKDATRAQEEMLAKARADIQADRDRLLREVDTKRTQDLKTLLDRTADLAAQIAAQVLPRQLNADDQRRLVDDALAQLREAGDGARRQLAGLNA